MGQSSSSCLGSVRAVVDQPRSSVTSDPSSIRKQNSVSIGSNDASLINDIDSSQTKSAETTISVATNRPPTPHLSHHDNFGENDSGVLNFLLETSENDENVPILRNDIPQQLDGCKARLQTKLFYRDPLILERYGLDVADETTVAGMQIYAARLVATDGESKVVSPEATDDGDADTLNSPTSSNSPENQDETSLLLPSISADAVHSSVLALGIARRWRFRFFGRSRKNSLFHICSFSGGTCNCGIHPHSTSLPCTMDTPPKVARCFATSSVPAYPRGCASFLFSREAVRNNTSDPASDTVCVSEQNRIYVADIGLSPRDCESIISVAERCSGGTWAAYTYAKQTLGCREFDDLASVCVAPVMKATATIMESFEEPYVEDKATAMKDMSDNDDKNNLECIFDNDADQLNAAGESGIPPMQEKRPDRAPQSRPRYKRQLVLDDREPHLVKYDLTRKERQKLDVHTDKSEWTFLISLSEGCGTNFSGGGTYFECIDSTVHLSRGHALIFPGKLRHRGQKITTGSRFLLVGFLVDKSTDTTK